MKMERGKLENPRVLDWNVTHRNVCVCGVCVKWICLLRGPTHNDTPGAVCTPNTRLLMSKCCPPTKKGLSLE